MGGSRIPGPEGLSGYPQDLNDGTLVPSLSPRQGSVGLSPIQDAGLAAPVSTDLSWEEIKADMEDHEALILHMYLDSENKVTVGVGNMLASLAAAQALGFVLRSDAAKVASKDQIKTDWDKVNSEAGKNMRAASFAKVTLLDLPKDTCWSLLKKRIDEEFLPGLRKIFSGWDGFPAPAKRALLDMAYNLGLKGLKKFISLISHVEKADWEKAAETCTRKGIPEDRNEWTKARFREAVSLKVQK
jgi:GH24 family phage-related lysozyme (muramidase)